MKTLIVLTALALATGAQAELTVFEGTFVPEAPGATGTGTLSMQYDDIGRTLFIDATWSGLSGNVSNSHLHCCTGSPGMGTAGVAVPTAVPIGGKAGQYTQTIDLALVGSYDATFLSGSGGTTEGAELRLISNLASGQAYLNIHTTTQRGGEIRAFVSVVPEPASTAMMLAGLAGLGLVARRRLA